MNLREDGDPDEEEGKEMTRGTPVTQAPVQRHQCRPMGKFDSCALPPLAYLSPSKMITRSLPDNRADEKSIA